MEGGSLRFDHRLPEATKVNWDWLIERYCRGKKVLDIGCGSAPGFVEMWRGGKLLHQSICERAREAVGLEIDAPTVARMRQLGFNVVCDNAEGPHELDGLGPFEVIIAGDVIEHVNNPGAMLGAMKPYLARGGAFIISTPNPFRWYNPVLACIGHEFNHPDHTTWFSPVTLTTLAKRHGYRVASWCTMDKVTAPIDQEDPLGKRIGKLVFAGTDRVLRKVLFRRNAWLADTIVCVLCHALASPAGPPGVTGQGRLEILDAVGSQDGTRREFLPAKRCAPRP